MGVYNGIEVQQTLTKIIITCNMKISDQYVNLSNTQITHRKILLWIIIQQLLVNISLKYVLQETYIGESDPCMLILSTAAFNV